MMCICVCMSISGYYYLVVIANSFAAVCLYLRDFLGWLLLKFGGVF